MVICTKADAQKRQSIILAQNLKLKNLQHKLSQRNDFPLNSRYFYDLNLVENSIIFFRVYMIYIYVLHNAFPISSKRDKNKNIHKVKRRIEMNKNL